ncbi:ribosome silencing factor [Algihabitans albus]|uniref:ribosome silencing factor n=1 Tax=Algihabitans albus TaxID=2164067 RepID=UPI000E5CFA7E|nr:ribosome silencing factor [Algihabitans albus]
MERSAEPAAGHPGDSRYLVELVQSSLDDDKAEDIVVIDLAGRSSIADYMVVASGRSTRQVGAIAEKLRERLKAAGYGHVSIEGQRTCDWVVIDALDVVVHIFRPEVRDFYNLEKMWMTPAAGGPRAQAANA